MQISENGKKNLCLAVPNDLQPQDDDSWGQDDES